MSEKKVLLAAEHTVLEPLALYYLSSIAKQEGWKPKIILSSGPEYGELERTLREYQPSILGFTLYTGNHVWAGSFFDRAKTKMKDLTVVVGGPHPTYFPRKSLEHADFAVVGEGFNSFRRILRGEAEPGIVPMIKREPFPPSDRKRFYIENPRHKDNRIKNVTTSTGCPFSCSHCYNSNDMDEVHGLSCEQVSTMQKALSSKRFFPLFQRPVKEIIKEIELIQKIAPKTEILFFEDDVFGVNTEWLKEFSKEYAARFPFHANMRFENVNPGKRQGLERLELLRKSGCTGLSLAIESGSAVIRQEVLNRRMGEDLIFQTLEQLNNLGFQVRTYQMLGLPYGATKTKTKINLDADLETLELNVRLKRETGLPTIAWASTLAPYEGTKIADYCLKHGFHAGNFDNLIGGETYRIKSVLRHPRRWVGPELSPKVDEWLPREEQERYRTQLNILMNYFPIFAEIPEGHKLAESFLNRDDLSPAGLNKAMRGHVYNRFLFKS